MLWSQNRDLWFTLPPKPAIPSCFMAFFSDPYSPFENFQFLIHIVYAVFFFVIQYGLIC